MEERFAIAFDPAGVPDDLEKPVPVVLQWQREEVVIAKASDYKPFQRPVRPGRPSGLGYAAASFWGRDTRRYRQQAAELRRFNQETRIRRGLLELPGLVLDFGSVIADMGRVFRDLGLEARRLHDLFFYDNALIDEPGDHQG